MSDYLSRLVARSLGAANVVRPETASLFEPRDTAPQQLLLAEAEVESPLSSLGDRQPPPRAATASARAVSEEHDAPAAEMPLTTSAPAAIEPPASAPAPVLEPVEPTEVVAQAETERMTPILLRAESREPRLGDPAPAPRTAAGRAASLHPLPTPPRVTTASAPGEPPVVQVTIGRVDVRAVQSARPAAPRTPDPEAPARQTLAEYLRKGARP